MPKKQNKRRIYDEEFKPESVKMLCDGHSEKSVASRLGVSRPSTIRRCKQQGLQDAETVAESVACLMWSCFILLSPVYIFESGQPQLADYTMALLCAWVVLCNRLRIPRHTTKIFAAIGLFVVYVAVVDLAWALQVDDASIAKFALFYLFNFASLFVFLSLYAWIGKKFLILTAGLTVVSVLVQVALALQLGDSLGVRQALSFNNPNQLGYWLILFCSIFWAWSQGVERSWRLLVCEIAMYVGATTLMQTTQSRAALVALALLFAFRILMQSRVPFLFAAVLASMMIAPSDFLLQEHVQSRFEQKSKSFTDELHYRGYDRILNHPNYLLFGAGEGAYYRFKSEHPAELHSSFGTVFFCYGALGLTLFLRLYWIIARDCGMRALVFLGPATAYGITHNGLRQAEFLLLFGLVMCLYCGNATLRYRSVRPAAAPTAIAH